MFDHIGFPVTDLAKSNSFYLTALAPFGIGLIVDAAEYAAFGKFGRAQFWLGTGKPPPSGVHLAFAAANQAEVRAFHAAAQQSDGTGNGAPGLRPHYHATYYGAFVLDPDDHNVEAVCRNPED